MAAHPGGQRDAGGRPRRHAGRRAARGHPRGLLRVGDVREEGRRAGPARHLHRGGPARGGRGRREPGAAQLRAGRGGPQGRGQHAGRPRRRGGPRTSRPRRPWRRSRPPSPRRPSAPRSTGGSPSGRWSSARWSRRRAHRLAPVGRPRSTWSSGCRSRRSPACKVGQPVHLRTDTFPGVDLGRQGEHHQPRGGRRPPATCGCAPPCPTRTAGCGPGMFANVEVLSPEQVPVLLIPATAVIFAPYGDSVFVLEQKTGAGRQGAARGPAALRAARRAARRPGRRDVRPEGGGDGGVERRLQAPQRRRGGGARTTSPPTSEADPKPADN